MHDQCLISEVIHTLSASAYTAARLSAPLSTKTWMHSQINRFVRSSMIGTKSYRQANAYTWRRMQRMTDVTRPQHQRTLNDLS